MLRVVCPLLKVHPSGPFIFQLLLSLAGVTNSRRPSGKTKRGDQALARSKIHGVALGMLVKVVIYDSGQVSLEHVLLVWYPSISFSPAPNLTGLSHQLWSGRRLMEGYQKTISGFSGAC